MLKGTPLAGGVNKDTDVGNLAGKCLIVTEKENVRKSNHYALQKAASFGARQRPAKLFQSASTEETTEATENKTVPPASKQPTKQRWSVLFGLKNPQQNQLCEILNRYAKSGVPQTHYSVYSFEHIDLLPALDYLENIHPSWMEFVCYPNMSDNEIKIQSAIWELVTTEVDYIHALQTVTDLFLACLEAIQAEHILNDVDQNKLFSNIRDICEANIRFWTMYMFPMVRHSINTGHPMCVDYIQPGFLTFATTFAPYKKYCAEQSTCQFYCKDLHRNNALFQAYLAWCEGQKLCNRLRLADILVRPMQRLTKYSLLLTAIRRHITDENDGEIMDAMIHSVENFVCSVNSHLTTRQENERLKGIMARIESYDVVDSNNEHLDKMAKQYSSMFDLCGPMKGCAATQGRHLFMEGDLKFKDNINKVDVHCFLLTDILLVCKTIAKKGLGTLKVIRQPFITDRLVIKVKENTLYSVYLNEFNVAVTAFTLQCPEAKSWHDAITKAKHIYSRLKQGSSWDGYNIKYGSTTETLGVKKSPMNSSMGSRVSSLNNSHSGSVELTESKTVSIDFDKANSLSSDEGMSSHGMINLKKVPQNSPTKFKGTNTLNVQPLHHLGQSLPNLNLNQITISNNTLLVPGTSGQSNLLSPSHRGISYPPPSPTRATLRRGFAFSSSIKNPPLIKSRNITSQNSFSSIQAPSQTSNPATLSPSISPLTVGPILNSFIQHQQANIGDSIAHSTESDV
ncbi:hypothetical protein HA402_008337 [Bradysia odoriphaga]|nr:hypothetical protein HA402_008337 [Bradysia odoriphaga]